MSTPNSQLSVAVQTWERHLFEVSELISSFFSRKMPTEKIQEQRGLLNKINEKIGIIATYIVYPGVHGGKKQ